ncbi:GPALPP motifs-containing protein 1 [Aspergillus stella-maris]|uniref:GPALPP motifs-containing protein 1 n=1 Tax=Aspergillus stella-maris TaxID=1810926 RepID=UPI003CCD343B
MDNPSKRKLQGPSLPTESGPENDAPDKRRKVIGPAMPPPTANSDSDSDNKSDNNDDNEKDSDSNSDSDDDFGPSLPPPAGSAPKPQIAPELPSQSIPSTAPSKPAPQRDAWMLAPPTSGSDRNRVDPTKLRNRKFQSGPRVGNASSAGGGGVDSSWTETPEEKMRRLQDEAMGVRPAASSGGVAGGAGGGRSEAEEAKAQAMREKVARYNEKVRGEESGSLVDEKKRKDKKEGDKEEKEDDPSKRAFDREKDMALSSKLTNAQRREMMSKAADFGSRFSKGKFL